MVMPHGIGGAIERARPPLAPTAIRPKGASMDHGDGLDYTQRGICAMK